MQFFSASLHQHIHADDKGVQGNRYRLGAQGNRSNGDDLLVVAEPCDDLRRENKQKAADKKQKREGYKKSKSPSSAHALVKASAVIVAGNWGKALPYSNHQAAAKHYDFCGDCHRADRGVAVKARACVEQNRRDAGQALPKERWDSGCDNIDVRVNFS